MIRAITFIQWTSFVVLAGAALLFTALNYVCIVMSYVHKRNYSFIPLFGGVIGVLACVCSPMRALPKFWLVPLILDPGTLFLSLALIGALIRSVLRWGSQDEDPQVQSRSIEPFPPSSVTGRNEAIHDFVLTHGVSLTPIGVAGYGVNPHDALCLVEIARTNKVKISGGDIYKVSSDKEISCTHLDWVTPETALPLARMVDFSCDTAIAHIKKAESSCGDCILVTIAFEGPAMNGEMYDGKSV